MMWAACPRPPQNHAQRGQQVGHMNYTIKVINPISKGQESAQAISPRNVLSLTCTYMRMSMRYVYEVYKNVCCNACRYSTGGFVDIAFTIQLFNAVLPHLAFIFRSDDIFNLHFLSHMACTQTYVDNSTLPPPFRMVSPATGPSLLYYPLWP